MIAEDQARTRLCERCGERSPKRGNRFCGACRDTAVSEAKTAAGLDGEPSSSPRTLATRGSDQRGRSRLNLCLTDDPSEMSEPIRTEAATITDEDAPGPLIEMKPVVKPDDPWVD